MAVYKEINRADGSGVTTFYRISDILDTAETDDQEGQAVIIDYNQAQNKPSINGVTLVGDKTSSDLGLQPAGDYITNDEADAKFLDVDELLAYDYVNETQLEEALANIEHFHREIVEALPVTGMDNVLYMVRKGGTGEDIYNEYIWVGLSSSEDGYEFLGTTATDLTDYYKKSQVDAALATKVDKEGGKGLSEQNYTLAEKTKLAGLENYDDSEIQADIAGLSNTVSGLSTTSTLLNNRITAIEPQVSNNTAAVSTIYDLLDKRITAIRLVEQGDGWVWMNLEGSRLTYAQASAALGHENCMLFIEQLENDGKVIPAEYKSEGDHINVIFKDLDSLVHVMTCGEDDALVTEDVTTTNGQIDFTVEDEAVGYTTTLDAIYGDTNQKTTRGVNLLHINSSRTRNGVTMTNYGDGRVLLNGAATVAMDFWVANGESYDANSYAIPFVTGEKYTLRLNRQWGSRPNGAKFRIITYNTATDAYVWTNVQDDMTYTTTFDGEFRGVEMLCPNGGRFDNYMFFPQFEKGDTPTTPENYSGGIASPNPTYAQQVHRIAGNNTVIVHNENLYRNSDTYDHNGDYGWIVGGVLDTNVLKDASYSVRTSNPWAGPGINFKNLYNRNLIKVGDEVTYSVYFKTDFIPDGQVSFGFTCYRCTVPGGTSVHSYSPSDIVPDTWYRLSLTFTVNDYTIDQNNTRIECNYYNRQRFENDGVYTFAPTSADSCSLWFSQPQLEIRSTASDYKSSLDISQLISLGNIELCKIGNCQDKIYKQNDTWYLHKEIGKTSLDGSESWSTYGGALFANKNIQYIKDTGITIYSDMYMAAPNVSGGSAAYSNGDKTISLYNGNEFYRVYLRDDTFGTQTTSFATWLTTHNVIIYYQLLTPTDTEITDQTLLAQLEALEQITQYKNNYIAIDGSDLTPEADFTYISNIVINNSDHVLGKDTYWNDEVPTSADLPANAQEGEIRIVQDTEAVYIYDGTDWIPFDKGTEVDLSNYLAKDNTTAWIPTAPFNPATKKYVDDSVSGLHIPTKVSQLQNDSNFVTANVNNLTNYYLKTNTYTKNEVDALIAGGGHAIDIVDDLNQQTSGKVLDAHQGYVLSGRTVPAGGSTGQVLKKESNTDYDTSWTTLAGIPGGGTAGQALVKSSATNYDAAWTTLNTIPSGGTSGQALIKSSNSDYAVTWGNIPNITSGTADPSGGSDGDIYLKYEA